MISAPKKPRKLANFSPTSSVSGESRRGSKKIDLNELDSRSLHSCYSFFQGHSQAPSVCSPPSVSSSCSVFRVNIKDSSSLSQASSSKKSSPYKDFNRSEIYKYPNLVKLNLDFYFTKKKGNRTKCQNDDKYSNVFAEFELNNDFFESHFTSEAEIQQFYTDKLNELQHLQEEEIAKFIKKWEKDQVDATSSDFQDFVFLQGTKIILPNCKELSQRPSLPEEKVNLRKANEKNEKLFELMSLRHEREAKLLVLDFQDQLRKFRERYIDNMISSQYQIVFEDNEASQISHITSNSQISNISGIKKAKNSPESEKDIDAKIRVDYSDDNNILNDVQAKINLDDQDSDWNLKKRHSFSSQSKSSNRFDNLDFDRSISVGFGQTNRTPPSNQKKIFDLNFQNSLSATTKKPVFQTSKRDNSYRPRFNNYV